jgi:cytidylate kinase
VIAVARTIGAGAEEVAQAVAQELGFTIVDEEIVSQAAEKHGLDRDLVQDAEQRRPLVLRLLDELGSSHVTLSGIATPPPMDDSGRVVKSDNMRAVIRDAVREAAAQGDVVIVAHAASIALADVDGVLRVLVTASPGTRTDRLAAEGMSRDDAAKAIRASDRARADYFKRFYGLDAELPVHYDLVLNTDRLRPEQAAALVAAAARG